MTENSYIREFVEYHLALGYDTIFISDNNHPDGERFEEVVADYIDSGQVVVTDYRGMKQMQCPSYVETYNKYSKDYDWMTFIDVDEFITLEKHSNIKDYLAQECFADYDQILLNWMTIGDSDQVRKTSGTLTERFTKPLSLTCGANRHVKSNLRRGLTNLQWSNSHYFIFDSYRQLSCDSNGSRENLNGLNYTFVINPRYDVAYIRHYVTKSIEEYISVKMRRRSSAFGTKKWGLYRSNLNFFWGVNKKTDEKITFAKSIMGRKEYWLSEYYGYMSRTESRRKEFKYRVIYPLLLFLRLIPKHRQKRFMRCYISAKQNNNNK